MSEDLRREPSDYFVEGDQELQADLTLARESGDKKAEAKLLYKLDGHYCFFGSDDIQPAVDYYQQALTLTRDIGEKHREALCLAGLGMCYQMHFRQQKPDYPKAIQLFDAALAIVRETDNRKQACEFLYNLGTLWTYQKDYLQALNLLEQSVAIAQELRDTRRQGSGLHQTGKVYREMKNYPQAIAYLEQAVSVYLGHESEDGWQTAYTLGHLAETYLLTNQYEQAEQCLNQGSVIVRRIDEGRADAFELRFGKLAGKIAEARAKLDAQ
jgi:tetratricopeptide (TPR) repeat protein